MPPSGVELVPYLEEAVLLRAVARVLALPLPVAATALALLHGARRRGQDVALPPPELVCGCLYAAAKAEEAQLSTNQAINAARLLALPDNHALLQALCPLARLLSGRTGQRTASAKVKTAQQSPAAQDLIQVARQVTPSPPVSSGTPATQHLGSPRLQPPQMRGGCGGSVLVGDAYYGAKDALFRAEQHVLRLNRFCVHVAHPYKHLLHMAHTLLGAGGGGGGGGGWTWGAAGAQRSSGSRVSLHSGTPQGDSTRPRNAVYDANGGDNISSAGDGAAGGGLDECSTHADAAARAGMALLHDVLTATALGATEAPEALAAAALVAGVALEMGGGPGGGGGGGISGAAPCERAHVACAIAAAGDLVAAACLDPQHIGSLAHGMLQFAIALSA